MVDTSAPSLEEFTSLLGAEISRIGSPNRRAFVEGILIPPYQSQLHWEYGADEPVQVWTFGDLGERDVVAQYSRGGFGARGSPWGINFRTSSHFGMDSGWYPSLEALADDWGVAE
jgi:hypothetical protein